MKARAMGPCRSDTVIRPGLSSGLLKVMPPGSENRIHHAALEVLATIGIGDPTPSAIDLVTAAGGSVSSGGRLCFPKALVEDTIANAARNFVLCGQSPSHDLEISGTRLYFGSGAGSINVVEPVSGTYSKATIRNLYDFARLADTLENIHFFQRTCTPQDIDSIDDLDVNTCYACVKGTTKHVAVSWYNADNVGRSLCMLHLIAGSEKKWRERPFVQQACAFVVPPLKFAQESCLAMEAAVRGGMPVQLISASQAGATAPVTLAGAVTQSVAECLAGLVYANLVATDAMIIMGMWPLSLDLRTGAFSGGAPESALQMAATCQMARFYDLPNGVCSGLTDAKIPDVQAGAERALHHALIANAGGNLVYNSVGSLASALGNSMAGLVIDNDIIGMALRSVTGVPVDEEEISLEVIRNTCVGGPGHYLGDMKTLERMESDFFYPEVSDRLALKDWLSGGSKSMLDHAVAKSEEILRTHFPNHINSTLDAEIRKFLPIKLAADVSSPQFV